ncbi:MAG TPA: hypothetical protein VF764_08305, partial [Steroidobacteraceae bacterium]
SCTALWWRSVQLLGRLEVEVAQLRAQQRAPAFAAPVSPQAAAAGDSEASASTLPNAGIHEIKPIVIPVPYGAEPLGGARMDIIRQQLYRLARQRVTGVADIKTFAGRFCLLGNALEGYSPAPEETLVSRCDLVGNPSEDAFTSPRTPLALANLIGEVRSTTRGALAVQVSAGDPASVLVPYPTASTYLNAGEWNRAAIANNRLEIRVH